MRRAAWLILILTLVLGGKGKLEAVETSSTDGFQGKQTDTRASSLKPSYLFNMRGRRDPFTNVSGWLSAGATVFNISGLEFKGMVGVDGQTSALFVARADRAMYTLRGSHLYGANDKPVAGVSGRFLNEKEVRLRQGELTLNFSAVRAPKRKI